MVTILIAGEIKRLIHIGFLRQQTEWMQLRPACFPGLFLSIPSSAIEFPTTNKLLVFYPEVICQLHLFSAYVLGDKTKEGKQITIEAHLPAVRACHQQSSPAASPGVPRKISLTFDLLLNISLLPLGLSSSAQPTLSFPSLISLVFSS